MTGFARALSLGVVVFVSVGCSSSENSPGHAAADSGLGNGGAGGTDSGSDPTPKESCVRPGEHGNVIGVGEYCTPLGKQCAGFDGAPVCLADVGQTQWFCTRVGCTKDDQCGAGAFCLFDPAGSACVLDRCQPKDAGGSDAH